MANVVYPLAKQRLLEWALASNPPAGGATLCVIGVKASYVYSAAHSTLADIAGGDIIAPEQTVTNPTAVLGVLDGDDTELDSMTVGQTLTAFIIYFKWASTTLLLNYMDTPSNGSIPQLLSSPTGLLQFPGEGIFAL